MAESVERSEKTEEASLMPKSQMDEGYPSNDSKDDFDDFSIIGIESCYDHSEDDIMTSQYAQVMFSDVKISNSMTLGVNICCHYTSTSSVKAEHGDRIALYKIGWVSGQDYLHFTWASLPEGNEAKQDMEVFLKDIDLRPSYKQFYQLCYLKVDGTICGASTPFTFTPPRNMVDDDEIDSNTIYHCFDSEDTNERKEELAKLQLEDINYMQSKNVVFEESHFDSCLKRCAKKVTSEEVMDEKYVKDELLPSSSLKAFVDGTSNNRDCASFGPKSMDDQIKDLEHKFNALVEEVHKNSLGENINEAFVDGTSNNRDCASFGPKSMDVQIKDLEHKFNALVEEVNKNSLGENINEEMRALLKILFEEETLNEILSKDLAEAQEKLCEVNKRYHETPLLVLMDMVKNPTSSANIVDAIASLSESEQKQLGAFVEKVLDKVKHHVNIPGKEEKSMESKGVQVAVIKPQEEKSCGTYVVPTDGSIAQYMIPAPPREPQPILPAMWQGAAGYSPTSYYSYLHPQLPLSYPYGQYVMQPTTYPPVIQPAPISVREDILGDNAVVGDILPPPLTPEVVGSHNTTVSVRPEVVYNNANIPVTPQVISSHNTAADITSTTNNYQWNPFVDSPNAGMVEIKCPICGIQFPGLEDLNVHVERHLNFTCPLCNKDFPKESQIEYSNHVYSHFIDEDLDIKDWCLGVD